MKSSNLLVTGASGFVGRSLCVRASKDGWQVRRAFRRQSAEGGIVVGEIGSATDWSMALENVDAVVHLAARVHVMRESFVDPLTVYREVNTEGALNLARQAVTWGVKRFVYVSTIKVNGEETTVGRPFTEKDMHAPLDPYGISKYEAEQGLAAVAAETGLEVVIIRPPLVYGPLVKANFARLLALVERGVPLPLALVNNRRSMVALDNLVDLVITCLDHPDAAGQTFLVSDGEDISTPELIRRLARAMGRPARLWPVPVSWLRLGGVLLGCSAEIERLVGSLQVDIGHTCRTLSWRPPVRADDGLRAAAHYFLEHSR